MTRRPIDQRAIRIPQSSGLLPCLYVAIAARDTKAIEKYVGRVVRGLSRHSPSKVISLTPTSQRSLTSVWQSGAIPELLFFITRAKCGYMSITTITGARTCARFQTSTWRISFWTT